jgi:hypothetical protein
MYNYYSSTMTALVAVILVITHCSVAIHGPCTNGAIRLAGEWRSSGYAASGNVEICLNNQWGGICSDRWMTEDAQVVCKQLGYSSDGAVPLTDNYYGSSSVEAIHLHGVQCTGDESYLFQCNTSNIGECTHQQVIGVACQGIVLVCMRYPLYLAIHCVKTIIQLSHSESITKVCVCMHNKQIIHNLLIYTEACGFSRK